MKQAFEGKLFKAIPISIMKDEANFVHLKNFVII